MYERIEKMVAKVGDMMRRELEQEVLISRAHLHELYRVLRIVRDTLPHINGAERSVQGLLEEIASVMKPE